MQKDLSSELREIKRWLKKSKVVDVILFGSFMRGKIKHRDIDLCILIKDSNEKKSLDLVDSLGQLTDEFEDRYHINILILSSFVSGNTLAKTLLNEGYSIKNKKKFSKIFGFESQSLFIYSLKDFSPSKRVKFHYLLKGRYESKGLLAEIGGKFLGTGSIIVPAEKEDILKIKFNEWKVKYKIEKVLVS
jgi:predicted nucleotidyltransferase